MKINPKSKAGLFLSTVVPGVMRPMRVLWNEVVGFLFIALAVLATPSVVRAYRALAPGSGLGRLLLSLLFMVVMLYFGVTSFMRARRISRS